MSWNYRIIKRTYEDDDYYELHEVYYEEGNKFSWTVDAICPYGETVEELRSNIDMMLVAFSKPVMVEMGDTLEEVT